MAQHGTSCWNEPMTTDPGAAGFLAALTGCRIGTMAPALPAAAG